MKLLWKGLSRHTPASFAYTEGEFSMIISPNQHVWERAEPAQTDTQARIRTWAPGALRQQCEPLCHHSAPWGLEDYGKHAQDEYRSVTLGWGVNHEWDIVFGSGQVILRLLRKHFLTLRGVGIWNALSGNVFEAAKLKKPSSIYGWALETSWHSTKWGNYRGIGRVRL